MRILIDMNLSPQWVNSFQSNSIEAKHWSEIGKIDAPDQEIFQYEKDHDYVIFTHDLDFGNILAGSGAEFPSVIQVRTLDTNPVVLSPILFKALRQYRSHLEKGALITIDLKKARATILPLKK